MKTIMSAIVGVVLLLAGSAGADSGRFECTVDVGIGVLKAEPNLAPVTEERLRLGGCELREVATRSHVVSTEAPAGCSVHSNDDGDIQSDRRIFPGAGVEPGAELNAFCEAGVFDAAVAVTLADASCGDGFCDTLEAQSCLADCSCAAVDQCFERPPGGGCFCDGVCVFGGDCCLDACAECGACEGGPVCGDGICDANGEDCEADCGCSSYKACERGTPNDFRCFCTPDCEDFGDCCPDAAVCAGP